MRKNPFKKPSRLAFRIASAASACIAAVVFLLGLFLAEPWISVIVLTLGTGILSLAIIYYTAYYLQFRRMEILNRINRNITRKRFEEYENLDTHDKDELDYLVKQTKRASKTVEREIQRLNRIENYRKEFIGDISHELKTPIFAIQGFIETLLNGAIEDEAVNRQFLHKAMRNVNRLIYLTKDLMEISKLETGELKSEMQDFYLRDVILDVTENLQHKARNEEVEIVVQEIDNNLMIHADRNQVKQVLANLVENAIKYNRREGSVEISVAPYPEHPNQVLVSISDTGVGIEEKYIERVTERFFRVDKSRSREKGGTGLGLAIVKHIMEAHEEEFFIESTPNVGSTFSFTLSKTERSRQAAK